MTFAEALQAAQDWASGFAWRAAGAVLVAVGGWLLAAAAERLLALRASRDATAPPEARHFVPAMVRLGVVIAAIALALDVLGIAGPVIGVFVTVGLAVGMLGDVVNGMRNLALRQFDVGDMIEIREDGVAGQVQEINMFSTTLRGSDGTEVIIPNRKLVDRLVIKHSFGRGDVLTVPLVLAPGTEPEALEREIREVLEAIPGVMADVPPELRLTKVEADAVTFTAKFSASPFDAELVLSAFLREAKRRFDEKGIAIRSLGPGA